MAKIFRILLVFVVFVISNRGLGLESAEASSGSRPKVIFIPGYYGSKISESVDKKGRPRGEVFLTLSNILFGSSRLQLEAKLDSSPSLVSAGILDSVSVIPWLYSIDGYGDTVRRVKREAGKFDIRESEDFYVFDYDWRLDPISILKRFDEKLIEWKLDSSKEEVYIVAHSMGGWLMSYWLRYGSQAPMGAIENWSGLSQVKRVMLVAAPFRGTLSVFRNSFWGAPGIPNDTFLGANVISSFPSTYYLTPNEAEFHSPSGNLVTLNLKRPADWIENRWGALKDPKSSEADEIATTAFVEFHVQQSAAFQEKILAPLSAKSERFSDRRIQIYIGEGFPTNELGLQISDSPKRFAFTAKQIRKSAKQAAQVVTDVDGDETVSTASASAPPYLVELGAESFKRPAAHLSILRDDDHIDWNKFFENKGAQ